MSRQRMPSALSRPLPALALAALTLAATLGAQSIPEIFARHRGSGTYELRGTPDSWPLTEARVVVAASGQLRIEIHGRNLELVMAGRTNGWTTRKQIDVVLESFDGKPTNVRGWIRLNDEGGFEQIELDGQNPARIGISFTSKGPNLEPSRPVPPIAPVPEVRYEMTEEPQTDRRGADYRSFRAYGVRDCSATCLAESRCRAYSFAQSSGVCYLKSDTPGASARSGVVSGVKRPVGAGGGSPEFDIRTGFDQPGGDYGNFEARGLDDCLARCANSPRCEAFTFDSRSSVCYLKDRRGSLRPADGLVTGARRQ